MKGATFSLVIRKALTAPISTPTSITIRQISTVLNWIDQPRPGSMP
jgi:hypothetical protein